MAQTAVEAPGATRKKRGLGRGGPFPALGIPAYALLTAIALVQVLPFVYMLSTAFKPLDELFIFPPRFYVMRPTLSNFRELLFATSSSLVPFTRYVFNTFFITAATVVLSIIAGSLAAYPLAMHNFRGKRLIFTSVILALTFAPAAAHIPRYLIMSRLRMLDTYWALILPTVGGTYGVFLMKQFLEAVPKTILDAARIDGAGELTIYWRIIMPVSKPAWATLAIFAFQGAWGDAASPLTYVRSEAMKTLPLVLQAISSGGVARVGAMAAAAMVAAIPGIIVFATMQRMVIETMVYSGIKS